MAATGGIKPSLPTHISQWNHSECERRKALMFLPEARVSGGSHFVLATMSPPVPPALPVEGLTRERQSGLRGSQCQDQKASKREAVRSFQILRICFSNKILLNDSAGQAETGDLAQAGHQRRGRREASLHLVRSSGLFPSPHTKAKKPVGPLLDVSIHISARHGLESGAGF